MTRRSDVHRVGALIPEDYIYVLSYAIAGPFEPQINIDRVVELRRSGVPFAAHGSLGSCTVCGARFRYGDVWRHIPTGEHIYIGHNCAEKYEFVADTTDRAEFDAQVAAGKAVSAAERIKARDAAERQDFLDRHPGLEEALSISHSIIMDIAARFRTYKSISERQVALVLKLAAEVSQPKPNEVRVAAPEGRQIIRGRVLSEKVHESIHGPVTKITIEVTTPEGGKWLAWGTLPIHVEGRVFGQSVRGSDIELTGTLARGREPHFGIFKRPTGARLVTTTKSKETLPLFDIRRRAAGGMS